MDLVAQGDSIYDIIDPADHLTVRQQLTMPSALDAGKNLLTILQFTPLLPCSNYLLSSDSTLLVRFSFCSPRSPFPLSIQHLQVPPAPECRQQTGAYSRSIPCSPTWGLLGRKPCVHSFLRPTGAKTPPWPRPWPWPWSCFSLPGHVPEPAC